MKEPNINQQKAVLHVRGPAILIAGPGSGKTFTIIARINSLICNEHIDPNHILVVTFSKAAANEMKNRFLKASSTDGVIFGTFHSFAYNILRTEFGFNSNSLISEIEKKNILNNILISTGYSKLCAYDCIIQILSYISAKKNGINDINIEKLKVYDERIDNFYIDKIYEIYNDQMRENSKIDFDDMILLCINRLKENQIILKKYQEKFKYIMVDEFQDINASQYELIKLISKPYNNIMVVGDDDQSIYGFRGSKPNVFNEFINDFINVKEIHLDDNYRCSKDIVKLSNKIIKDNSLRFKKDIIAHHTDGNIYFNIYDNRGGQIENIIKILKSMSIEEIWDSAVILRTNLDVVIYSSEIEKALIPVKNIRKSNSFTENFIFDDILSFIRYIYCDKSRELFVKFMNKPNQFLTRMALRSEVINEIDILNYYHNNSEMTSKLNKYFNMLKLAENMKTSLSIKLFRKNIGYDKYLLITSKSVEEYNNRIATADKVEEFFKDYKKGNNIGDYIKLHKSLYNKSDIENKNGVNIITMHTAKGLEYKNVFLPDLNEGVIPSVRCNDKTLEEERRLLYVAITRTKNNLYLSGTKERNRDISKFIKSYIKEYKSL